MTEADEGQPLLPSTNDIGSGGGGYKRQTFIDRQRETVSRCLESPWAHVTIISLIVIDALCVLIDLGYAFLTETCVPAEEGPIYLSVLEHISEVITCLFVIEIPLSIFAFSWRFYAPRSGIHHAGLHLFDAIVILTTFVLEIILKGRERELVSLLIILRLWRLVKLVAGVAVGSAEVEEETSRRLTEAEKQIEELEQRLSASQREKDDLRRRLAVWNSEAQTGFES